MRLVFRKLWSALRGPFAGRQAPAGTRTSPNSAAASVTAPDHAPASAPHSLSREEITTRVLDAIDALGARGPVDHERVMGYVMPRLRGQATGAEVSTVVSDLLARQGSQDHP